MAILAWQWLIRCKTISQTSQTENNPAATTQLVAICLAWQWLARCGTSSLTVPQVVTCVELIAMSSSDGIGLIAGDVTCVFFRDEGGNDVFWW